MNEYIKAKEAKISKLKEEFRGVADWLAAAEGIREN